MFLLPNVTTIDLKIPDEKFRETASINQLVMVRYLKRMNY